MGLLNFSGVVKEYGQRCVLGGVTFSVERGERLALIGPNGGGKTTLVRIAMGLETADLGTASLARGTTAGYLRQDLSELGEDESALRWGEIAALEEKIHAAEAALAQAEGDELDVRMREYSRLTARYEAMDGYRLESRMKATVLGLGLNKSALYTPLARLSSGERMRVALARILLKSPDLLVLDEPTNHLDIAATTWLEGYLRDFDGGALIVSHDRYFIDRVCTRIVELSAGTTMVFHGNYTSFLEQRDIRARFYQSERDRLELKIRLETQLARKLRASSHITQAQSREKRVERLKEELGQLEASRREGHLGKVSAVGLRLSKDHHNSEEIASAENGTKRIGDRVLFRNVNFLIRGGERVAIIGPNGCGKTTLLRILLGLDPAFEGRMSIREWVRVGVLDQNAEFEDDSRTMTEELMHHKEQKEGEARALLARVGYFGDEVFKRIAVLSGGERVRLKLALLLQDTPQCLVLDEPTNHLDLPAREAVEQAVEDFTGTVIAVSHDRYFLNRCFTRILAFEGGTIRSYPGNWDVYERAVSLAREEAPNPAKMRGAASVKKGEALDKEIEAMEARIPVLTGRERERAEKMLEELYARFLAQ